MNIFQTNQKTEERLMHVEARAENAEQDLHYLKQEVETAHRVLDAYVGRSAPFGKIGHRLTALCERIELAMEKIAEHEADGWDKYHQQMNANTALKADRDALRESFDRLERENLALRQRKEAA